LSIAKGYELITTEKGSIMRKNVQTSESALGIQQYSFGSQRKYYSLTITQNFIENKSCF